LQALAPAKEQMQRHGAIDYKTEVARHLSQDRLDTVLALCGRKFKSQHDNAAYFAEFYEFARQRLARTPTHSDGIYVCRIFVEEDEGRLTPFMADEFKRHEDNRQNGVLGLTMKAYRRSELDKFVGEGFSKCLDEGFGFLLFHDADRTATIIIHEGMDHDMAFVKLTDELNLRRILDIYKILCMESVQYNTTEKQNLRELLKRLQLPADGP
jgi:hypothetical protein